MTLVLHAQTPAERSEWLAWWVATGKEPFAHPAFVELFCRDGETALALALRQPGGRALLPLVRRPIPGANGRVDAVSPYGYGGPFSAGEVDSVAIGTALRDALEEQGFVSAFVRLSLDSPLRSISDCAEVVEYNDNVVVALHRSETQVWQDYDHKVRKNVKKARRAGCTVVREELPDWTRFTEVYAQTMIRRGASAWYRFDETFFRALAERLPGSFSVFNVLDSHGTAVSVELVLQSDRYLYSFLGGTLREAFPMAPNDLLKHEVVRYGIETGRLGYVLGGGVERGDGIFRYKRAFDPAGVVPFRAMRFISDAVAYERLARGKPDAGPDFFPAYRAGL